MTGLVPGGDSERGEGGEAWATEDGVTCVVCPSCAFTFDAVHVEADGSYDCPACFAHRALYLRCSVCGKRKYAGTPERAAYVMAFHMDRRHRGWSITAPVDALPAAGSPAPRGGET